MKIAAQKIKALTNFLHACKINTNGMFMAADVGCSKGRILMHARIGEQFKVFKKAIKLAGWKQVERVNLGGGEYEATFTHPDLVGNISIHEFSSDSRWNKIYLSN